MFEALQDFYDFSSCYIEDEEEYKEELRHIEFLLYGTKNKERILSDIERKQNLEMSNNKIRSLFRRIHRQNALSGLYLPIVQKRDPSRAIATFN